jgi:hypothetical protein
MRISYEIDYKAIADHIDKRIADSSIIEKPFPHIQIDNVLPEEYYEILLDALPLPQDIGCNNSSAVNFAVADGDKYFDKMSMARKSLWKDYETKVNQHMLRPALVKLFSRYAVMKFDAMLESGWRDKMLHHFGKNWENIFESGKPFEPGNPSAGRLLLIAKHSKLRPHVDDAASLFTYLLYMPRDNNREHLGTKIHIAKNYERICTTYRELKPSEVWYPKFWDMKTETHRWPFRRNTIVGLLCLPSAIHSAKFKQINYCRYLLQTQVFLAADIADILFEGWGIRRSYAQ